MARIERLCAGDGERWRRVRLQALSEAPYAFSTTYGEAAQWDAARWEEQVVELATFVAVVDGHDVGVARGAPHRSQDVRALISMWVAPSARRRGIARQLIDSVAAWAKGAGAGTLVLDVVASNAPAIALYERADFVRLDGEALGEHDPNEIRLVRSLVNVGDVSLLDVQPLTPRFDELVATAAQLNQAKYIAREYGHADEVLLLGAVCGTSCVGFILCLVQVIGREEGRPALRDAAGTILREGYVEAFGVLPEYRRRGIGRRLQEQVVERCVERGCYQLRSRSPTSSTENYALKLSLGYAVQPSTENDSYFFVKVLPRAGVGP